MKNSTANSLLMGSGCGVVGLVCGVYIAKIATSNDYSLCWVYASIAAFLTGVVLWWLLIEKAGPYSMLRGAGWMRGCIVGGLTGFIAHFVFWIIQLEPNNPEYSLVFVLPLSLFSLAALGLVTIPVGIVIGGVIGRWRIGKI